jgi:hypothetical protein
MGVSMDDKYKGDYPKAWSEQEIDNYLVTGNEPRRASNGVWVNDLVRDGKDLIDWSLAEMLALYSNELNSVEDAESDAFKAALKAKIFMKHSDIGKWTESEMYDWLVSGKEPDKTPSGNFINDPERFVKDANLLNDSELTDFGLGYFGEFERNRGYVLIEALTRFGLHPNMSFDDFSLWCKTGQKPAVTARGSLRNDRTRSERQADKWAAEEILDWVDGEIDAAGIDEASLLARAIEGLGGEWYWSKANVSDYVRSEKIPDEDEIDLSVMKPADLLRFARELKSTAAAEAYLDSGDTSDTAPAELSNGTIPSQWSRSEAIQYVLDETLPPTWNGVLWVNDKTRDSRTELTPVELDALYHGGITHPDRDGVFELLLETLRSDMTYERLYDEEALALHFDKVSPQRAENGVLVLDRKRDQVDVGAWSDEDIRLLAQGVISTKQTYDLAKIVEGRVKQWDGLGTEEQKLEWFLDDTGPELTPNGLAVTDPRRCSETIRNWANDELIALVNGWITAECVVEEETLLSIMYERGLIKAAEWTLEEATLYVNTGCEPEKTSFGTDKIRYDEQTITRKSDLKFYSDWANGFIELPNDSKLILNRVRELTSVTNVSDDELMLFLKNYKADGGDTFFEPTVHDLLHAADSAVLKKVCWLWNLPEGSTKEEAEAAYEAFEEGHLVSTGVLRNDARRETRAASLWELEELRAWARGEIATASSVTTATMANAMRKAISTIDPRWDDASVKAFVATGEMAKLTSNGVLVIDIVRDKKWPSDWSDEEIKAYLCHEVISPAKHGDVLLAGRNRFKVPSSYDDESAIRFILTGEEKPKEPEKPFTRARAASDEQLKAWLNDDFVIGAELAAEAYLEMRSRFKIDPHWTDDAIKTFFVSGVKPKMTATGLFVDDRLRDNSNCGKWSFGEIKALANDEITAPKIAIRGLVYLARARTLINVETNLPADKWSADEILTYLRDGVKPVAAIGNVFVNDPQRAGKEALSWSNDELKAWLRKEIDATQKAPEEELWLLVYQRFQVPSPWYHEDARSYVLTGKKVPATPSGIWVRDRERDGRHAYNWSRAEVKAWARNQILPGLKATEEELVIHAALCFNLSRALTPAFIKGKIAAITEDTTPMTVSFVREDLLAFVTGMKKEGAVEAKAAMYQQLLNRCIARVCKLRGQDFVDGWTELLQFYFNQKNLVFKAGKLYAGVSMMQITSKQQQHFQYITTVLYNTCDPETRAAAVKKIDWAISLAGLPEDEARHQILAYYDVQ